MSGPFLPRRNELLTQLAHVPNNPLWSFTSKPEVESGGKKLETPGPLTISDQFGDVNGKYNRGPQFSFGAMSGDGGAGGGKLGFGAGRGDPGFAYATGKGHEKMRPSAPMYGFGSAPRFSRGGAFGSTAPMDGPKNSGPCVGHSKFGNGGSAFPKDKGGRGTGGSKSFTPGPDHYQRLITSQPKLPGYGKVSYGRPRSASAGATPGPGAYGEIMGGNLHFGNHGPKWGMGSAREESSLRHELTRELPPHFTRFGYMTN